MNTKRPLFLALETYSKVGGIQRFNQRVIAALGAFAEEAGGPPPRVHLLRDRAAPPHPDVDIRGFGSSRIVFGAAALLAAQDANILLVGHVSLLPVAFMIRLVYPRLPIVLFAHGIEVWNDRLYRRRRVWEPLMCRAVDTVAAVSAFTGRAVHVHFGVPESRIVTLPNAVDPPLPLPEDKPASRLILCVARMEEHDTGKNIDVLLEAFKLLLESHPDASLEIVGDGGIREYYETIALLSGIAPRVKFRGRVSEAALADCYERAALFALPSSKEGFGIVYLEAWRHGLPVICSTRGAATEIVTDGVDGFAVDPSDPELLADRMSELLDHPERARTMAAAGARKVSKRYLDTHFRANLHRLLHWRN